MDKWAQPKVANLYSPPISSYLEAAPTGPLQMSIVGKDWFPRAPTPIPFCKSTWDEQLALNCSGRYVLSSIGIDLLRAQNQYQTPQELFEALRSVGIVFLNASYTYIGGSIRRKTHSHLLKTAHEINRPYLQASKNVVYCGEAWKVNWVESIDRGELVVHPDVRNKANPRTKARWAQVWSDGALLRRFGLSLPFR